MTNGLVSVIVLGYTRFAETTGLCLASLSQDPDFADWELVLVDNGSDGADRAAFDAAQRSNPKLNLVRLAQNAGYPGGMNAGLRAATGDTLILVSSDILLPRGAVGRLAAALNSHPRAGLIAPVTNAAGNEQQIYMPPTSSTEEVLRTGQSFADAGEPSIMPAYRLDFCCVALARAAYEAIGGFDEAFIPGYYEDFDYSMMARKAGFDLLLAENVFVYHEGGATFGRVSPEKKALIAKNKQRFLDKHGGDTPLPHNRDGNLAILRQYLDHATAGTPPPALRIANRLKRADADSPRGLLKRWRYRRALAAVAAPLALFVAAENAPS